MILNECITIGSKIDDPLYIKLNYNKMLDKHNIYIIISSPDLKDSVLCIQSELSFVLDENNNFVLNCIDAKEVKSAENIKIIENSVYEDTKTGVDDVNSVLIDLTKYINNLKNKYNQSINEDDDIKSNISIFKDTYSINSDNTLIKNYRIKQKTIDNEIQEFLKILIIDKNNIKNNIINIITELIKFIKTLDVNVDNLNNIILSNIIKFLKMNEKYNEDIYEFLSYCVPEIVKLFENIENKSCNTYCSCLPCCCL